MPLIVRPCLEIAPVYKRPSGIHLFFVKAPLALAYKMGFWGLRLYFLGSEIPRLWNYCSGPVMYEVNHSELSSDLFTLPCTA